MRVTFEAPAYEMKDEERRLPGLRSTVTENSTGSVHGCIARVAVCESTVHCIAEHSDEFVTMSQ